VLSREREKEGPRPEKIKGSRLREKVKVSKRKAVLQAVKRPPQYGKMKKGSQPHPQSIAR